MQLTSSWAEAQAAHSVKILSLSLGPCLPICRMFSDAHVIEVTPLRVLGSHAHNYHCRGKREPHLYFSWGVLGKTPTGQMLRQGLRFR